jgi:hypothetical protein
LVGIAGAAHLHQPDFDNLGTGHLLLSSNLYCVKCLLSTRDHSSMSLKKVAGYATAVTGVTWGISGLKKQTASVNMATASSGLRSGVNS